MCVLANGNINILTMVVVEVVVVQVVVVQVVVVEVVVVVMVQTNHRFFHVKNPIPSAPPTHSVTTAMCHIYRHRRSPLFIT
jgi:hypothetical protein